MVFRKLIITLVVVLLTVGVAQAEVDNYVNDLNLYASKSFDNFRAELSFKYGISRSRFDKMLRAVDSPGDLAVSLWLGFKSQQPIDAVVKQYRLQRGQGWGVIAREVGIKPGSPAFKKLKAGEIDWYPKDFDEVMKDEKRKHVEMTEAEKKKAIHEEKLRKAIEKKEKRKQERLKKNK